VEVTKQVEHRKKRREDRRCAREGCPELTGDEYRCPKHRDEHAASMKAARQARRRQAVAA